MFIIYIYIEREICLCFFDFVYRFLFIPPSPPQRSGITRGGHVGYCGVPPRKVGVLFAASAAKMTTPFVAVPK